MTPPGWEFLAPEKRGRLVALVLARQAGRGDVIATPTRLYAQVDCDASGVILRGEVAALAELADARCPGGCGVDLAIRNCICDDTFENMRNEVLIYLERRRPKVK